MNHSGPKNKMLPWQWSEKLSKFEIKLFGSIEIYRDGQPITRFRSQKALALLAFLITEGRPITREYLAGLIWPEAAQAQALGLLRRSLHSLSKQLPDCLEATQRTVSFKSAAPADIDTHQFTRLASQKDIAAWSAAIDRYRAPFLEGVYLADCPTFEQWLITEQKRWQDQADDLLAQLIQALIDQGDYRTALTYANRRLALAPWQEETHRQVMRLLFYNGQRSAALAQYDQCVVILNDELGVDPTPETQALYEQIKQAKPYPPHNLLPQVTPFLGRDIELKDLTRLLANSEQRLITLVGPGGMGKTRLAIAAAERQLGRPTETPDSNTPTYAYFTHGIYLASLVAIQQAGGLVPAIADALNFQMGTDDAQRTPKQQLLDYLRQKRLLLILDNFEQLLQPNEATETTSLLLEILQTAPEVQLLVTSRERLQVAAEQVYIVQGLSYPDVSSDAEIPLPDYPAIALFNQIAQHIQPDFRCEGEIAHTVVQICGTLQGMPLAIELAAATINVLSPTEILTELTQSLDLLATTTHHIPARHRSIRAAFETSWHQLRRDEQAVFQKLSVFQGGFTKEAAEIVAGATLPVLAELTNKSFIRYRHRQQRYEVHGLMRQFGAEQLGLSGELERQVRQRHCQFFVAKLEQWARDIKGPQQQTTLHAMTDDHRNFRLACQWAVDHEQFTLLSKAIDGPGLFCQWQGRYQEGIDHYQAICQGLSRVANSTVMQQLLLVKALTWKADFSRMMGKLETANQCLQQGLSYLDRPEPAAEDTRLERASVLLGLGQLARDTGAYREAIQHLEQSIALYRVMNDGWGIARGLTDLCFVIRNFGKFKSADQLRQQLEQAEQVAQESVTICRKIEDWGGLTDTLTQFGAVLFYLGRFSEACSILEEDVSLAADLGKQGSVILANFFLGTTYLYFGRYKQARNRLQSALNQAREIGYHHQVGEILYNLGTLNSVEGSYTKALPALEESLAIHKQRENQHGQCFSLIWLGYAKYALGDKIQAGQHLVKALQIGTKISSYPTLWLPLPLAALLCADQGELEQTVELYSLFLAFCLDDWASSIYFEDLAGRKIAVLATTLPPEVVAAAEERGRQRDLWETAEKLLAQFTAKK